MSTLISRATMSENQEDKNRQKGATGEWMVACKTTASDHGAGLIRSTTIKV